MRWAKLSLLLALVVGAPGMAFGQAPLDSDDQELPPGHPPLGMTDDEGLPPGHPPTEGRPSPGPLDSIPQSSSENDSELPAGTILVELRDGEGGKLADTELTLGILQQSVSKGESRRRVVVKTNAEGEARFDDLETGSGISYRVSVSTPVPVPGDSTPLIATHDAPPFQLDLQTGKRVRLHVFPVTSRIEDSLVGLQAMVYVEVKDDTLQLEQAFTVFNLGKKTWVPHDIVVDLPKGFRAFFAPQQMSDIAFDQVAGRGVRLRGTFTPGQHELGFRYQVPWDGSESVALALGLPPHVARMSVISEATKGMTLEANDFPPAQPTMAMSGQRILLTERQLRPGDAQLDQLVISLGNLPGPGPGRWIALGLAGLFIAGGLMVAFNQSKEGTEARAEVERDAARARERLVEELRALDEAKKEGEVGPETYAQVRKMLVDALARLLPAQ